MGLLALMLLFCESPCSEIGDPLEFDGGEGGIFFYWLKEEAKNELYLLSACYSSRADGGGGVGSQGAWE